MTKSGVCGSYDLERGGTSPDGGFMTGTSCARAIALIVLLAPGVCRATIATKLTAGPNHACALSDVGGVQCWGLNANGELGNGTFSPSDTPVDAVGLASGVTPIATATLHTCVVTSAGAIKGCGANNGRHLGDGDPTHLHPP